MSYKFLHLFLSDEERRSLEEQGEFEGYLGILRRVLTDSPLRLSSQLYQEEVIDVPDDQSDSSRSPGCFPGSGNESDSTVADY